VDTALASSAIFPCKNAYEPLTRIWILDSGNFDIGREIDACPMEAIDQRWSNLLAVKRDQSHPVARQAVGFDSVTGIVLEI
jgi:hypothetical protein